MKLLLTSNGLCNKTIANRFVEMIGKPINEASIAFVPTAANLAKGTKDWFVNDLYNISKLKPKMLDIVDIAALPKDIWQARLEAVDVLFFSGGNTYYLMYWLKKSGLDKMLPKFLENKLYAGISAGSIAATKTLLFSGEDKTGLVKEYYNYEDKDGLALVDFYVRPHYEVPGFSRATDESISSKAKDISETVYGIDNETAIAVVDNKIEIVSEGKWKKYN